MRYLAILALLAFGLGSLWLATYALVRGLGDGLGMYPLSIICFLLGFVFAALAASGIHRLLAGADQPTRNRRF